MFQLEQTSPANQNTTRSPRYELGEVPHGVVHRLLHEFVVLGENYDWSIDEVVSPVRSTASVQAEIPVDPTNDIIVQILKILFCINDFTRHWVFFDEEEMNYKAE